MALATALHHSAPRRQWEEAANAAPRGQTSGTSAGRPGIPSEPAPQGGLVAPPSPSSGDVPSLSIPVLACRASEAVDSSTLSYLLAQSLKEQEEQRKVAEEKEKVLKAKKEEEKEPDRWVQDVDGAGNIYYWHRRSRRSVWRLPDGAFVKGKERRRKKKKRRRRRLRKTRDATISTATVTSTCVCAGPASFSRRT